MSHSASRLSVWRGKQRQKERTFFRSVNTVKNVWIERQQLACLQIKNLVRRVKLDLAAQYLSKDSGVGLMVLPSCAGLHADERYPEFRISGQHLRFASCFLFERRIGPKLRDFLI
ncbi:MAG TPA: hypothetical protein VFQ41_21485 [Candidatus Angelobacter sp.]|nr:hypothetical protein [Candidatus Angelobacter sp.]